MTWTESRPPKQESASRSEVDYRMKYVIERDLRTAPSKIHLHIPKKNIFLNFNLYYWHLQCGPSTIDNTPRRH